ncbi:hypothetical protein BH10BAC5_BH10BAC5_03110 [soil metagenome]
MNSLFLEFEYKDILNLGIGFIAFALFSSIFYFIGKLGVYIRSGYDILKNVYKVEKAIQLNGLSLNERGISYRQKGKRKLIYSLTPVLIFYFSVFIFFSDIKYIMAALFFLCPLIFGLFGILFVPEDLSDD